jgi:hypothetical protein
MSIDNTNQPNDNTNQPNDNSDDLFGDSEIAFSVSKLQKIKENSDRFYNIFLAMFIIVLVALIFYYVFRQHSHKQSRIETHYNNIFGDVHDRNVDAILRLVEDQKLGPMDNYRVGVVQIQNIGDVDAGNVYFHRAIEEIMQDPNDENAIFVIDGIRDFRRADNEDLFDFLDQAHDLVLDAHLSETNARKIRELPKNNDPEYVQKAILAKQKWNSDAQNVHDSKMTEVMTRQFHQIREENIQKGIQIPYTAAKQILHEHVTQDKYENVTKTLDAIERNDDLFKYIDEIQIFETVVSRAMDPANKNNRKQILEALADSLADGANGYGVVCITGRSKLMWQSLALLDYKQDIGVMKSKQMIRNEIFEKVAKIIIDEEAKETPETLAIYTKGGTNEQTEALKARILNRIDCIQEDYRDIANPEDINMAIAECRAEIV